MNYYNVKDQVFHPQNEFIGFIWQAAVSVFMWL